MNIISATLIYFAPFGIAGLWLVGIFGKKYLKPTFRHQWFVTALGWMIILPLHLQFSGWAVTPGMPVLLGAVNWPGFNIYNIPQPTTLWGVPYDYGFLNTSIMHAVAAWLFVMTIDLFIELLIFWQQAFVASFFMTLLLNVWKINEIVNHFNGSPLDTQIDWLFQNFGILITCLMLWLWDRHQTNKTTTIPITKRT